MFVCLENALNSIEINEASFNDFNKAKHLSYIEFIGKLLLVLKRDKTVSNKAFLVAKQRAYIDFLHTHFDRVKTSVNDVESFITLVNSVLLLVDHNLDEVVQLKQSITEHFQELEIEIKAFCSLGDLMSLNHLRTQLGIIEKLCEASWIKDGHRKHALMVKSFDEHKRSLYWTLGSIGVLIVVALACLILTNNNETITTNVSNEYLEMASIVKELKQLEAFGKSSLSSVDLLKNAQVEMVTIKQEVAARIYTRLTENNTQGLLDLRRLCQKSDMVDLYERVVEMFTKLEASALQLLESDQVKEALEKLRVVLDYRSVLDMPVDKIRTKFLHKFNKIADKLATFEKAHASETLFDKLSLFVEFFPGKKQVSDKINSLTLAASTFFRSNQRRFATSLDELNMKEVQDSLDMVKEWDFLLAKFRDIERKSNLSIKTFTRSYLIF